MIGAPPSGRGGRLSGSLSGALLLSACVPTPGLPPLDEVPEIPTAIDVDSDPGTVEVELRLEPSDVEILEGVTTRGLAYCDLSGAEPRLLPGPVIEVQVGQTLTVWLTNGLPDRETTLHFHGMRTPADLDGNPLVRSGIDPGRTMLHRFVVREPGLYWFHPHLFSDEHVELGLQGLVVARAPDEPRAARERIFVLDDVDLLPDGSMAIEPSHEDHHLGRHGPTVIVNGRAPGRIRAIAGATERWRFVNTANGRHFALWMGGRTFEVIALDGPPLDEPVSTDRLEIAPGERRDVLVHLDGAPGSAFWLETLAVPHGDHSGDWEQAALVRVDLDGGSLGPVVQAGDFVRTLERLPTTGLATRRVVLETDLHDRDAPVMTINGATWPFGEPLEARLGDVEIWEVENTSELRHPFHVHGTFFQVVDRDGVPEPFVAWRDTMPIAPLETVRIALRYDAPGRWMFHCQIPEHAHMGMMGDLVVGD